MLHYGIEVVGIGRHKTYVLKSISDNRVIIPVDYRRYRTEAAARNTADALGIQVEAVGDVYDLVSLTR